MSKNTQKNHFSPVFSNKYWTNEEAGWKYKYYYFCENRQCVIDSNKDKGKTAWGYELNLYSQELEDRFDRELENESAILYEKLIAGKALTADERMKWGQFIVTQAIRTPSFFKYRDYVESLNGGNYSYKNSILGCAGCEENKYIAARNWVILMADENDFFVRTDNPVYMTGFLNNPSTTIFYPLTPELCFVACSAVETILLLKGMELPFPKQEFLQLEKGDAWSINFELLKSASSSIIVSKKNNSPAVSHMALQILGLFPQIPFMLSSANNHYAEALEIESITNIMSMADGVDYPPYRKYPFNPFYGIEFSEGINPFSVFGVTNERLRKEGLIE
ncbi:DUF4238 domain-containing protein [Shewanella baltica]|uniref:DUF4238 domain-containing protein n=1 Tax=Shewanella baltica TaxID=62322 RepID=UPI00217CE020|nr:DUF4238 domain-containing protein [Shewanella baltica]MCS6181001.1 DUF4238 domain-containing protein [Shewanella baltica]MCS6257624.1 DUF4238 domain-containing protein [Shewanella baltica]